MSAYTTAPSPNAIRLPPLPSQETGLEASLLFSICQYLDLPGPSQSRCRELDHILVLQMPVRISDLIPVNIKSFHWILRKPLPIARQPRPPFLSFTGAYWGPLLG